MSNLVHCEDCEVLVETEVVDGECVLSCGCEVDSYLREEDCQPLDFEVEEQREYLREDDELYLRAFGEEECV